MSSQTRSQTNGVMQFHETTPREMLKYVLENAEDNNPRSVIDTIDKFCWENHWMMHVGDTKGKILENTVKKYQPQNVLELGTYCGYSAITMLANMDKPDSKVYTIDPDGELVKNVTKKIIKKAGLSDRVVFLTGYSNDMIERLQIYFASVKFDLVFLDHDKKSYYPDLLIAEKHNVLNPGAVLVADNVIVFKINDYLDYVQNKDRFDTTIYKTKLEYNNLKNDDKVYEDGVVVSQYKWPIT